MSDLRVTPTQLERSRSQLSVRSYFDPQLFQRERDALFAAGRATSARALVPCRHYLTCPVRRMPFTGRTPDGGRDDLNVCRTPAVMLRGRGHTPSRRLPLPAGP